jgi:hypothetical protein
MWRAMASLLVLRDQVNVYAPNRSRASDGLVGDTAHQGTNSDHNPHYVPGVGSEIVSALDLTHDPAHGFDSYRFAEVLRQHRDPRIKYVISNHRIFSSYASGSRPAWAWGSYNGVDPHTNHVHVSVLDARISDTRTPWNLVGMEGLTMVLTLEDLIAIWTHDLANGPAVDQAWQVVTRAASEATAAAADAKAAREGIAVVDAKVSKLQIPAPAPVDPAALKAVLLDPEVLAAIAKAVIDEEQRRLAG